MLKKILKKQVKNRAFGVKKNQGIFEGVYLVLQLILRRMVSTACLGKLFCKVFLGREKSC